MPDAHELTLSVEGDGEVRASTPDAAEAEGRVALDELHRSMIELFDDWVRDRRLKYRREYELLGALLWRSIFPPSVESLFDRGLELAREAGARLRIQLVFREPAADLTSLPWEFMFRPRTATREGVWPARDRDIVLSRHVPLRVGRGTLAPAEPPLRILLAASQPSDLGPVVVDEPTEAIERLEGALPVEIAHVPAATLDALLDALTEAPPHVVHFLGHGEYNRTAREGRIALIGEGGRAFWMADSEFANLFHEAQAIPRMIVLHLCEGGVSDFTASFAGLALQLARRDVQAVVAMQYPVSNRTAIRFTDVFYGEIAKGRNVDDAMQHARWRLGATAADQDYPRDFGAPVLYLRSRTGVLRPPAGVAAAAEGREP
jgi:CHAT domain